MSSFANLLLSPPISALIAAVLYLFVYASFLNLLKYPRNWYFPSASATSVTGTLAFVLVAFVSVSSIGPEIDLNYNLIINEI